MPRAGTMSVVAPNKKRPINIPLPTGVSVQGKSPKDALEFLKGLMFSDELSAISRLNIAVVLLPYADEAKAFIVSCLDNKEILVGTRAQAAKALLPYQAVPIRTKKAPSKKFEKARDLKTAASDGSSLFNPRSRSALT